MLDLQSNNQLSKDELREIAPSIFSTKPSPEVSKKYSHIPTDKLIDDMGNNNGTIIGKIEQILLSNKELKDTFCSLDTFQKSYISASFLTP